MEMNKFEIVDNVREWAKGVDRSYNGYEISYGKDNKSFVVVMRDEGEQ